MAIDLLEPDEVDSFENEVNRLKTTWVKILRQRGMLEECQGILDELGIKTFEEQPPDEVSDVQKELQERNFFIPFEQIAITENTENVLKGRYFNGLEVKLVKRTPLNPQHM